MKKTLIIHAGMHKAGTTTIQRWLSESSNLSGLYAYRHAGNNCNMGLPLFTLFGSKPEDHFFGKAEALPKMSFQRNCQKPKADTLKYLKISQHAHYPSI